MLVVGKQARKDGEVHAPGTSTPEEGDGQSPPNLPQIHRVVSHRPRACTKHGPSLHPQSSNLPHGTHLTGRAGSMAPLPTAPATRSAG